MKHSSQTNEPFSEIFSKNKISDSMPTSIKKIDVHMYLPSSSDHISELKPWEEMPAV